MSRGSTGNTGGAKFSGWHFLMIMAGAFGIVISANLTLAWFALGSFPGLDVPNSYIASQQFDHKRKAQEALGWESRVSVEDDRLMLHLVDVEGMAVFPQHITIRVGSATTAREDQAMTPQRQGDVFIAPIVLASGNKVIFIDAVAEDGTLFSQRHSVVVK